MNEQEPSKKPKRIRLTARDKYYLYEYGNSCGQRDDAGYKIWSEEWNERIANAPDNDPWKHERM